MESKLIIFVVFASVAHLSFVLSWRDFHHSSEITIVLSELQSYQIRTDEANQYVIDTVFTEIKKRWAERTFGLQDVTGSSYTSEAVINATRNAYRERANAITSALLTVLPEASDVITVLSDSVKVRLDGVVDKVYSAIDLLCDPNQSEALAQIEAIDNELADGAVRLVYDLYETLLGIRNYNLTEVEFAIGAAQAISAAQTPNVIHATFNAIKSILIARMMGEDVINNEAIYAKISDCYVKASYAIRTNNAAKYSLINSLYLHNVVVPSESVLSIFTIIFAYQETVYRLDEAVDIIGNTISYLLLNHLFKFEYDGLDDSFPRRVDGARANSVLGIAGGRIIDVVESTELNSVSAIGVARQQASILTAQGVTGVYYAIESALNTNYSESQIEIAVSYDEARSATKGFIANIFELISGHPVTNEKIAEIISELENASYTEFSNTIDQIFSAIGILAVASCGNIDISLNDLYAVEDNKISAIRSLETIADYIYLIIIKVFLARGTE